MTATETRSPDSPPIPPRERAGSPARPALLILGAIGLVATVWLVCNAFLAFAYYPQWFLHSKLLIGALGLVFGIGGAVVFFRFLNMIIEGLP